MAEPKIIACLSLAGLLAAWPLEAKDQHAKRDGNEQSDPGPAENKTAGEEKHNVSPEERRKWTFSDEERELFRTYVDRSAGGQGKHARRLPPGLAKKVARGGQLPPGWEQKCAPGEILPPEVYAQCHPLPPDLVIKLPLPPEPTITVAIDGRVLRLIKATREILDVFQVHLNL